MGPTSAVTIVANTDGSGNYTIPQKRGRKTLLVSLSDGAAFKICVGTNPDTTNGIFVPTGRGHIIFQYDDWGNAMNGAFIVRAASGAAAIVVYAEAFGAK